MRELVSAGIFPDTRENTGKFGLFRRGTGIRRWFPHDKSGGCGEIPYAKEQGIFSREQRISSAYQGMPHEHGEHSCLGRFLHSQKSLQPLAHCGCSDRDGGALRSTRFVDHAAQLMRQRLNDACAKAHMWRLARCVLGP